MEHHTLPGVCQVRSAVLLDAQWMLDLSSRVQAALTASGSLQELTSSTLETVQATIQDQHVFILSFPPGTLEASESDAETRIGSVIISSFSPQDGHGSLEWGIEGSREGIFYLHSLMLETEFQGRGTGKGFLKEALSEMERRVGDGKVLLDCWAGNEKLRGFYEKAGFNLMGVFPEEDYEIAVFLFRLDDEESSEIRLSTK